MPCNMKKSHSDSILSFETNENYGSISSNDIDMGSNQISVNHQSRLKLEKKEKTISSLVSFGSCVLILTLIFWIVDDDRNNKDTNIQKAPLMLESFEIPFPKINRGDYGTNPIPASSIVDPTLFAPNLRNNPSSSLLKVPFPTGAFWTNLVIEPTADRLFSYPIMSYPYGYKWNPDMIQVSYPSLRRMMDELSIRDIFNPDLTLGTLEAVAGRYITYFDPVSVTLRFQGDGGWSESYLVQGSPYLTLKYEGMTPVIRPISIFKDISCLSSDKCQPDPQENPESISLKGTQFILTTRENLVWILFSSKPTTIIFDNIRKTTISTQSPFTGVIRLALLPPLVDEPLEYTSHFPEFYKEVDLTSSGVQSLIRYSNVYPVAADISWDFPTKDIGSINFHYETRYMSPHQDVELLMLALPHHIDAFSKTKILDKNEFDLIYKTIKGHMTPVLGSTWSYNETLTTIGFDDHDRDYNVAKLNHQNRLVILDQVAFDVTRVLPTLDENVYGYGKQLARLAQLVHIAHVLLKTSSDDFVDSEMKQYYSARIEDATATLHNLVTAFLEGRNGDVLLYDVNFGGLVTNDGLNDFMGDFGNGWYNDHHFHYGYFLYSCALLGYWNSTFVSEYGMAVDAIMYDVTYNSNINSKQKTKAFFPLARHKSWFDSHSFASGLFPFASGKSMESSSESINCYYASYLWSTVRRENDLINFTRLLLAMEIRGVKTYWHISSHSASDVNLYNPTFSKHLMVGNLGMMDVTVSTWFGSNPLYVHMINFVPITAITREMFEVDYLKKEFDTVIQPIYDTVEMAWKGYVVCDRAMIDPQSAWNDALELRSYELDQAISQSQVLYFITTIGTPDDNSNISAQSSTTDEDSNVHKDVNSKDASCSDHEKCASLGLKGLCCPSPAGTNLDCCNVNVIKTTNNNEINDSTSCSTNAGCASLGLTGECCPTITGDTLSCCDSA